MRPLQATRAALLLLSLAAAGCLADEFLEPDVDVLGQVDTSYMGYKITGQVINITSSTGEYKIVNRYRAVPYAQPPTGSRRFAPPVPLDFSAVRNVDATKQAPLCPQDNTTMMLPYDEDCLFFNIWSPNATFPGQSYPVLVYIHGGRFETGGIAEPELQGETLLRNQDVVLVTINYRLGATGFLYLDDKELQGNFGLLDQRLALQTIAAMASSFSGDPSRITLAGHGTGAASVGFHIAANQSVEVKRAILMGGSVFMPIVWSNDKDTVRQLSERFVNGQLDCSRGIGRLKEVIECLRVNVTIEKILEHQINYRGLSSALSFMPVLDELFFKLRDPLTEWGDRRKGVTIMMGVTSDSGSEFVDNSLSSRNLTIEILNRTVYYEILRRQFEFYPRFPSKLDDTGVKFLQLSHTEWSDMFSKELLRTMWSRALGDFSFLCPTLFAIFDSGRPKPGDDLNTFLYYFNAPDHIRDTAPGHMNDLRYFFGIPDGPGVAYPADHNKLSKRMMADLGAFVTNGTPNANWGSIIAGEWNFNDYILNDQPELYNITGGFAIRRCRWWHETLSFVNRLEPSSAPVPQISYLPKDPFQLDETLPEPNVQPMAAEFNHPEVATSVIGPIVRNLTTVNARITGHILETAAKVELERYLGIRYAKPPIAELRFAKPEELSLKGDDIDATTMPKACPQSYGNLSESEDCLFLNIWTPKRIPDKQFPVLVYIHGGFFENGGINDPNRSGEKIAELGEMVVVTIGYRLGALGFLPFLSAGSQGNYGLFDQELALKWIDAHIENFGGNTSLITLVGDDAGAVSIGYHMIRNSTGFSKAILQTGSPSLAYPLSNNTEAVRQRTVLFLQLMGCNRTSSAEQLACMRAKSVDEIKDVYTRQFANKFGPDALVTLDLDFFKEDPWMSVQSGNIKQVPMIVGFVDRPGNEIIKRRVRYGEINLSNITEDQVIQNIKAASYFNPRKPQTLTYVGANLIGMQYKPALTKRQVLIDSLSEAYSDRFFTCGNNEFLNQVSQKRHPLDPFLYHYIFTEKSNIEGITTEGAGLSQDTFYMFGNPLRGNQWTPNQQMLSEKVIELFARFAQTGNPNPAEQLGLWYEYNNNFKPYLILDADVYNVSVNWGFRVNDCGFWHEVLPYVNSLRDPIIPQTTLPPPTSRPPIGPEGEIEGEIEIEIPWPLGEALSSRATPARIVGDQVRLPSGKLINRFLGVPYAQMPLTRFANAQFPAVLNVSAKTMPPYCPQIVPPSGSGMSEDCLFVNIWAPVKTTQTHPIAVFLHGGNYSSGANSLSEYRGEQLLDHQDVIFVSVNYRLGALGFLYLDEEKLPGNFGLMDQRLALSFIKRIGPSFGGNANLISLIGHGTDAASAAFHALTDSKDSFSRLFMMGGSPAMPLAWSSSNDFVRGLSERYVNNQVDCARGPLDEVLKCLRSLPLARILTEQLNMQNGFDHLIFLPVFAKSFFNNVHPYKLWSEGKVDKPIVTGVGSDSGRYYTEQALIRRNISWEMLNRTLFEQIVDRQFRYFPRVPEVNTPTGLQFLKLGLTEWNYYDYNRRIKAIWSRAMGDFNFLCPIWEATSDLLKVKSHPVYTYYIDVEDPFRGAEGLVGADHWGDIRYLFGDPFRRAGYPESHKNISRQMMDDFVNHMKGTPSTRWTPTNFSTSDILLYDVILPDAGGESTPISLMVQGGIGLNEGRCPLWKHELPYVNTLVRTARDGDSSTMSHLEEVQGIPLKVTASNPVLDTDTILANYSIALPGFGTVWGQTVRTHLNATISQFLGIPFAKPPTGDRRFAKPEKLDTTDTSIHHAFNLPPMCIQKRHLSREMSEDCLYLNVWTPKRDGNDVTNLPVLVFLPGGFFEVGGTNEDRWRGSKILDHHQTAIVVTINYRLGVFGFLSLDDKDIRGNFGLWDQDLALQWVSDHIDKFGGNKNLVTLMGVEAGAVSIGYHMARKAQNQNRFHQAILMTGSPYMSYPLTNDIATVHRLHGVFVRNIMRCEGGPDMIKCIRAYNDSQLNELQALFQKLFQGIEFSPVLDGDFITKDPWLTDPKDLMHIPLVYGGVDRPGNFMLERIVGNQILTPENFTHANFLDSMDFMNNFYPRFPTLMTTAGRNGLRNHFMQYNQLGNFQRDLRDLGLALSDRYFTCPNNRFLDAYSKASSQPVYNYLFTESKVYNDLPLEHASLFEDAFYAFGNPTSLGPPLPNKQTRLSIAFMESLVTFVQTGSPSSKLKWDKYDSVNKTHLLLNGDVLPPTMFLDGYRRQECGFWDNTLAFVNGLIESTTPTTPPRPTRPPIGPDGLVLGNATAQVQGVTIVGQRVLVPNGLKNISRFLGVPYAAPPVNDLRFAPPKAMPLVPGTFIAHNLPPACPQDNRTLGIAYSEDCLYMNIWTPNAEVGRNYPVIVYIHGGNFETGSISQRELFGETLLSHEDVVLVTIAYRLGSFGFLYIDDSLLPGNVGLLDQRMALSVVKQYVSQFGGDPLAITLAGHGMGAAAVGFHSVSASKNLFKRAILMGGSPTMPTAWYGANGKENTQLLNRAFVDLTLGCSSSTTAEAIACARKLDVKTIVDQQTTFLTLLHVLEFRPVLDQSFFAGRDPLVEWRAQAASDIEMMMGFTTETGGAYVDQALARANLTISSLDKTTYRRILNSTFRFYPRFPEQLRNTGREFLELYLDDYVGTQDKRSLRNIWSQATGDRYFLCPVWESIVQKGRNRPSTDTYLYVFTARDPFDGEGVRFGSDHLADLQYFFGLPAGTGTVYPASHTKLSTRMMRDLVQFARTGRPNTHWPKTKLGIWDYSDYNDNYEFYNATEGAKTIQRCGVWYYDLPYVDNLVKATPPLIAAAPVSQPVKPVKSSPRPKRSPEPTNTDRNLRNYTIAVSGYGQVFGRTVQTMDNNVTISKFLGVRYAEPPVGNLRFMKPTALRNAGDGVTHVALSMGAACYQRKYYSLTMSEDCLTLNIWTPKHSENSVAGLPVIVFIHGGFFEIGSSAEPRWDGSNILDHEKAVIVTINYRLGAFGFLALDSSPGAAGITGNMGLFDQEAAISWVSKNIEPFGGDKSKITLAGVEAGSISIGYHLTRQPNAIKSFSKVIMMTGSPMQSYPLSDKPDIVRQIHREFARTQLNCSANVTDCLQRLSAEVINEKQEEFNSVFRGVIEFQPIIDKDFFEDDPWKLVRSGAFSKMPMIIGQTSHPGNFLVRRIARSGILDKANFTLDTYRRALVESNTFFPRFPTQLTTSGQEILKLFKSPWANLESFDLKIQEWAETLSDRYFTCDITEFVDLYMKASPNNSPIYYYVFVERELLKEDELPLVGAPLFEEAFYFFGNPSSPGPPASAEQAKLSDDIMSRFIKFASDSNPNMNTTSPTWNIYEPSLKRTKVFQALGSSRYLEINYGYRRQECGWWENVLPYVDDLVYPPSTTSAPTTTSTASTSTSTSTTTSTSTSTATITSPTSIGDRGSTTRGATQPPATTTTQPPIGPIDGYYAIVTVVPILGAALIAGAVFIIVKLVLGASAAVAPVAAATSGGATAAFAVAEAGVTAAPSAAPATAQHAEVVNEAFDPDAGNANTEAGNPETDAGNPEADAGNPEADAGNPEAEAGNPEADAGNPDADAGGSTQL